MSITLKPIIADTNPAPDDDDAPCDLPAVAAFFGVSLSTINRARKEDPEFPAPERLRPNGKPIWTRRKLRAYRDRLGGRAQ